jgi:hypothetical protein
MNFHQFKTKYLLKIAMRNFAYMREPGTQFAHSCVTEKAKL